MGDQLKPKKMSPELDEQTLKEIVRLETYNQKALVDGNCRVCQAPLRATHYEIANEGDRRCQLCKMLGIEKAKFREED